MLTRSLCCFSGISTEAERKLWKAGCLTWDYLGKTNSLLSSRKAMAMNAEKVELQAALSGKIADCFLKRLPCGHRLRVWPHFHEGVAFLDIETSGLRERDDLTVIGLWQAGKMFTFVRGENLHHFLHILRKIEVLVTFNGIRFDWPFIARSFRLSFSPPHIDLLHEARAFGLTGGLKQIEKRVGIKRKPEEEGDGANAVKLWQQHLWAPNNKTSLTRLLKYNAADVRSLIILSRILLKLSFEGYPATIPSLPPFPYNFHSFFDN